MRARRFVGTFVADSTVGKNGHQVDADTLVKERKRQAASEKGTSMFEIEHDDDSAQAAESDAKRAKMTRAVDGEEEKEEEEEEAPVAAPVKELSREQKREIELSVFEMRDEMEEAGEEEEVIDARCDALRAALSVRAGL